MKKHYEEIVKACDKAVGKLLGAVVKETSSPDYGGIFDFAIGMVVPGAGIGCMLTYVPAYYNKDSKYYKSEMLMKTMFEALEYTERIQREDGTFDLLISNFHSAPDTGFIMHGMVRTYRIMDKHCKTKTEYKLKEKLYGLIKKAAKGLHDGGFHTPNHRWVEAAGLSMAYNITKEKYLKDLALMYLAEGIDIDENGEFTERSPGIYNAVNDNALMILAEELDMPELFEHAVKNLTMMFSYFEPDGSIFTQNSVRIDKGEGMTEKSFYPVNYYHIYLKAAYKRKNPFFAKMACLIFDSANKTSGGVPGNLWLYMTEEGLKNYEPETAQIEEDFEVFYKPSDIVRRRKKDMTVTILGNSPNFLFVQKGNLRCYVRMCASFFAIAQFKADEIIKTNNGYRMEFTAHGKYKWPFEIPPETSVWEEMNHDKRKTVNAVYLKYIVNVIMTEDGVKIKIKTEGCDRVPIKVEFCFSGGCRIKGENFMMKGSPGGSIIPGSGYVEASLNQTKILVGPAFSAHAYTEKMRGSVPVGKNDFTIYFTGFSNIEKTIEIKTR